MSDNRIVAALTTHCTKDNMTDHRTDHRRTFKRMETDAELLERVKEKLGTAQVSYQNLEAYAESLGLQRRIVEDIK